MSRDHIDVLCEDWARTRRQLTGLREPIQASEYLGAVHCTLGSRRDLHAGSRSVGRVEQFFPEVYRGNAALINAAFRGMAPPLKEIMDLHYVVERPRNKRLRADLMGISGDVYWSRVGRAKTFLEGAIAIVKTVATEKG